MCQPQSSSDTKVLDQVRRDHRVYREFSDNFLGKWIRFYGGVRKYCGRITFDHILININEFLTKHANDNKFFDYEIEIIQEQALQAMKRLESVLQGVQFPANLEKEFKILQKSIEVATDRVLLKQARPTK
jgi:hypothetical protein